MLSMYKKEQVSRVCVTYYFYEGFADDNVDDDGAGDDLRVYKK